MRYSREEWVNINACIKQSKALRDDLPGTGFWMIGTFLMLAIVSLKLYGAYNAGSLVDLWVIIWAINAAFCAYALLGAWGTWRMYNNLPIHSVDDLGIDEPPPLPIMESGSRPAPMVQTARNQWRRPNLAGLLSKREQALMWQAVASEGWHFSRPVLERGGITGLTGYTDAGITRYAAILNEMERCGVVANGRVNESALPHPGSTS